MRVMRGGTRWRAATLTALLALSIPPAARAEDSHRAVPCCAALGPLISSVAPDGFALTVGTCDGASRAAILRVFDIAQRPAPGVELPPLVEVTSAAAPWHTLRAAGLLPLHRYRYRLLLPGASAESTLSLDGEVNTAPPPGDDRPLTLVAMGDERGASSGVGIATEAILGSVLAEAPDLVIGTGDLVPRGDRLVDWVTLLRSHGALTAQLPYYVALGNHELVGDPEARMWKQLFPIAKAGHFAVRHGALLLVFLNGNRPGDAAETAFLDEQLGAAARDPGIAARFVVLHQAPLSGSLHCGLASYMAEWVAHFERHKVDAVIAGHDHAYERLERNGVAYFVTGGAGAPLYDRGACEPTDELALQRYESVHHYLLLRIVPEPLAAVPKDGSRRRGAQISVIAKSPQGPPFDSVTLPLGRAPTAVLSPARLDGNGRPPARWNRHWLKYALRHHRGALVFLATLLGLAGFLAGLAVQKRRRRRGRQRG